MRTDSLVAPSLPLARLLSLCFAVIVISAPSVVWAQEKSPDADQLVLPDKDLNPTLSVDSPPPSASTAPDGGGSSAIRIPDVSSRENFSAAMQIIILLTVLS